MARVVKKAPKGKKGAAKVKGKKGASRTAGGGKS